MAISYQGTVKKVSGEILSKYEVVKSGFVNCDLVVRSSCHCEVQRTAAIPSGSALAEIAAAFDYAMTVGGC